MANENKDLQERIKLLREEATLLQKIEDLEQKITQHQKTQADLQQKINSFQETINVVGQEAVELQTQLTTQFNAGAEENKKFIKVVKQQIDIRKDILDALKDEEEKIRTIGEEEQKNFDIKEEQITQLRIIRNDLQKVIEKEKEQEKITDKTGQNLGEIREYLSITSTIHKKVVPQLQEQDKKFKSIGEQAKKLPAHIDKSSLAAKKFSDIFKMPLVDRVIAIGKELDTQLASFNKTTAAGGKFNKTIDDARFGMLEFGVGLEQSKKATEALFLGFNDFVFLSKEGQKTLTQQTALLERLGVSSEQTAKNVNTLTKTLGMTAEQAIETQKELALFATQAGLAPSQVSKEFEEALPRLSAYGKQATSIFRQLELQAKATGLSMSDLLSITEQFDTFGGASEAAGKLNAILGGGLLNSVELLTASEEERVKILRQAITESGRSFNSMTKFEQKAVAASIGISDMTKAAKLFGTSDEEFARVQATIDETASSTAILQKYAQEATSAQEKWQLIFQSFSGAALPVLNVIQRIITAVLTFTDAIGASWLVPAIVLFTGVLIAAGKTITFINSIMTILTGKTIGQTFATGSNTAAQATNTVSVVANTTAIETNVVASNASVASRVQQQATTGVATATNTLNTTSVQANTTAQTANNGSILAGIIAGVRKVAVLAIETAASWAATAAIIAMQVAEWLAVAATTALGIAMLILTSPITLIVLGVVALIAGITALVYWFEEITTWIGETTGGFLDLWDVFLLASGPVGWFILAGKKIYENWEFIVEGLTGLFTGMVQIVKKTFASIINFIKSPINASIDMINGALGKINGIPGVNVPLIPHLAEGTTNFEGGLAVVGEKGPELVSLPAGTSVFANPEAEALMSAIKNKNNATSQQTNIFNKTQQVAQQQQATPQGNPPQQINIVVDGRALMKFFLEYQDKEMKANLVAG